MSDSCWPRRIRAPAPSSRKNSIASTSPPRQFGLLGFLWQEDGISQAELSARAHIDQTTMGGLIDRLAKMGLVERRPHPEDRRAYQIFLTQEGKRLQAELCPLSELVQARFVAAISADELTTLKRILNKLRRTEET